MGSDVYQHILQVYLDFLSKEALERKQISKVRYKGGILQMLFVRLDVWIDRLSLVDINRLYYPTD